MEILRQGDILLVKMKALPKANLKQEEGCILAHGEATGHSHEVLEHGKIWVEVNNHGRRYLEILADTSLKHQEHGEITLKGPGVWEIVRQREYAPEAIRNVLD